MAHHGRHPDQPRRRICQDQRKRFGKDIPLGYITSAISSLFVAEAGGFITCFLLALFLILYAILDQKTRVFTHTSRRVMAKVGIISRKNHEVTIGDIRSIHMHQGIVERLFGLGTVQIGSAGTGGIEVEFKGIQNPAQVQGQIRRAKDEIGG